MAKEVKTTQNQNPNMGAAAAQANIANAFDINAFMNSQPFLRQLEDGCYDARLQSFEIIADQRPDGVDNSRLVLNWQLTDRIHSQAHFGKQGIGIALNQLRQQLNASDKDFENRFKFLEQVTAVKGPLKIWITNVTYTSSKTGALQRGRNTNYIPPLVNEPMAELPSSDPF